MRYFDLYPELAGVLGENTVLDTSIHPPIVHRLNYEFLGWPEDAIQTSFPCFVVTEQVQEDLLSIRATGMSFDEVEVNASKDFYEFYPERQLPKFVWLKVDGTPGKDDFGLIHTPLQLIVSERVIEVLKKIGLSKARVLPFEV